MQLQRQKKALLLTLMIAASSEFIFRGPLRAAQVTSTWNDFLSPYVQTKIWAKGGDPYNTHNFVVSLPENIREANFRNNEDVDRSFVSRRGMPSPYPVTSFALLAPFSLLPWSIAQVLWIMVSVVAIVFSLFGLISLAGVDYTDSNAQLFLGISLALAPIHSGIATLNPTVPVLGLCVGSVWAISKTWNTCAGVLIGIAICLKPHIGLCFLFYYFTRCRWKVAATACVWIAVIAGIAIFRLAVGGTPWSSTYLDNTREVFAPGAINDFTTQNPVWYNLINTQVLLGQLVRSPWLTNLLTLFLGLFLVGLWFYLVTKYSQQSELLAISCLVVLNLLPVYHRFYDAAFLIWPLSWSLMVARKQYRRVSWLVLICILPFLVPGPALLNVLSQQHRIPSAITDRGWWNALVISHQAWAVLLIGLLSLCAMKITYVRGACLSAIPMKIRNYDPQKQN